MSIDFTHVLCKHRRQLCKLQQKIKQRQARRLACDNLQAKLTACYARSKMQYAAQRARLPQPKFILDLPVLAAREKIAAAIANNQVVIISGETGSGKTTQLPQICLSLGLGARGMIAHTQPRRIAARSVAERIADELQLPLGQEIGYQVRFDAAISANTIVKLMTDGMLLAETINDKLLVNYEVIIIDEAHERSLNIDFLLGYVHKLLPQRPDLKLIITSATIDSAKFAQHFNDAPCIDVSGRSYPVAIRYRPEGYSLETLLATIEELDRSARGDILVFFATERDIHEAAQYLRDANLQATEILPLFGRLSLREQRAVFRVNAKRRIVLATNVAETALTVPRIKYVIDIGMARISRYSLRSKTQRLPIEAISQASANQRAGRCGRTSAGICVRLYSEEDYRARSEFTAPEILRTNLAAVILQMLALDLGKVADFPFVDAPEQRQINDGYRLLYELKAVDARQQLTDLGRKMAQLPLDPRFSCIIFTAAQLGALQECLTILAVLSMRDPRERPLGKEQQAASKLQQFSDKNSDFQTLLNIYNAYEKQREKSSNNKRREWCANNFLNAQRMREWRELRSQLLRECQLQGLQLNQQAAHSSVVHRALLVGFLDQIGVWNEELQNYNGTRNRKFHIFPSSALAKKKTAAIMAASIVEIERVVAHTCAPLDVQQLQQLAAHLLKYHYDAPHWSKKAGNVMVKQTALLYGLMPFAPRKVPFATQNAAAAHQIFVQEALVSGEINCQLRVIDDNLKLFAKLQTLEDKTRSRGIVLDEQAMAAFYFARLPEEVHSVVTLEKWARKYGEKSLQMSSDDLLVDDLQLSTQDYPEKINVRGQQLQLQYAFNPGGKADGVTVLLPLAALNACVESDFEQLVPAMFSDKIIAILRSLPKAWRRQLLPLGDFGCAIAARLQSENSTAPLLERICGAIFAMKGIDIPVNIFDLQKIDEHYRMNFRLLDKRQNIVAESRDLIDLQSQFANVAAAQFAQHSQRYLGDERPVGDWQWQQLPLQQNIANKLVAYTALTVVGDEVFLRIYDDPQRAQRAHHDGVLALLRRKLNPQIKYLRKNIANFSAMSLCYRHVNNDGDLFTEIINALLERVCLSEDEVRDRRQFERAVARGEQQLVATAQQFTRQLNAILNAQQEIRARWRRLPQGNSKRDIDLQLSQLLSAHFIRFTPIARWQDLPRYLQALASRLDKIASAPLRDVERLQTIAAWQEKLNELLAAKDEQQLSNCKYLDDYFYLLQEYRVSVFAQEIGTKQKVSPQRLQTAYAACLSLNL